MTALPFNIRFKAAAKFFAAKVPMTRAEFDLLSDWAKTRAFTVAGVTKARALQRVMGAVRTAIEDGLTLGDFNEILDEVLDVKLAPWHAELVLRNNVQGAYGTGRLKEQRSQREHFPYLQLHEVIDYRTRATHRAANGTIKPVGHDYWKTHYPPWGNNCRGHCESLTEEEVRELGGVTSTTIVEDMTNDERFTSPGASDGYDPDVSELDPPLRASLRRALMAFDPSKVRD